VAEGAPLIYSPHGKHSSAGDPGGVNIEAKERAELSVISPSTLDLARNVLAIEANAVARLADRLDGRFLQAVEIIFDCRGRVVVSGIGKSGHIARKIASTLASTGTPAFFVHPAEASHGDLGMIQRADVFIGLSYSGESTELLTIIPMIKRQGAKLIAITGNEQSSLARQADVHLDGRVEQEACPLNLAPTASTTAALALGDALAVALLDARGFNADDFARSHPGGTLGRRLLTHVKDAMRSGPDIPCVPDTASFSEALLEMSRKRMGMTAVTDDGGHVKGVFTDGDLRRTLERVGDIRTARIADVMTRNPRSIGPDRLAAEAVQIMESHKVNQLLVVDASDRLVGALNMHDLFRAKVI
jgi:arabinose-5-phosphate isomerase